jgi:D-alanine-D-alanine ligase
MNRKPNIAIIAGGDSSEYIVSLKSGRHVFDAIDTGKFIPWLIRMKGMDWDVMEEERKIAEVDKSDFSFFIDGQRIRPDFAYITIHGTPGENGVLQGYFDLLKIPFSTSDIHSSSLTFNKWYCNHFLRSFNIKMPRSFLFGRGSKVNPPEIIKSLGLPLFVKPNAGGSSFGVTKVRSEKDLIPALENAWHESSEALVDEYISGTEFTCGLVRIGNRKIVFPVTEVIPKNDFFDFEAKYTPGATEEITPARLPASLYEECQQLSSGIYDLCHCAGIVRIDFILRDKAFYFLEVNTTPGMTETSFIPQQIGAMGLSLKEVLSMVIEDRLKIT